MQESFLTGCVLVERLMQVVMRRIEGEKADMCTISSVVINWPPMVAASILTSLVVLLNVLELKMRYVCIYG